MCSSCLTLHLPGLWMPPASQVLLGWQGRPPAEVERWGREAQVCLPSPCPAAPVAPERWQRAPLFLLTWFSMLTGTSDGHSELHTPGSCSRGGHQKGCSALGEETYFSWHSTLQPAWLQLGLLGMLHPVALSQLIDQEYQHPGLFSPAPWKLSHSWSDQLLFLSVSPPQLLNTQTRRA